MSIPAPTVELLRDVACRHAELRLVMLFGSVANGTARINSDVDIAVLADRALSVAQVIMLAEDFSLAMG